MPHQHTERPTSVPVTVRPLREADLAEADRIFHLAFGTFLGLPDPMQFHPDRDFVVSRARAGGDGAFAAVADGALIGSSFLAKWGSVAVFGPLTIRPDFWERGAANRLLEATVALFPKWGTQHAGLFTFPHSAKHVHLYQKFGFWPRFLTAVMSAPVRPSPPPADAALYSERSPDRQSECLQACGELTDSLFAGLDLQREIRAVASQQLGDTVLLTDNSGVAAFAVCHCGAGTEAGHATCYVKFGAARSAETFERLLDACETFAARRGLSRMEAGVNLSREHAYRSLRARGYRTEIQGVTMHAPNEPGYSRPDVYIIDDWR